MAEPPTADGPLGAVHPLERFRAELAGLADDLGAAVLTVALEPDSTRWTALTLRLPAAPAALRAAADGLGRPLPVEPHTWSTVGGVQAFRLGPDEWLVVAPADDADRAGPAAGAERERRAAAALRPHGGTAVDVSAQYTGLRLDGAGARGLLAFGCSLDLRARAFGPGTCARTVLWQVPALLAADEDGLQVVVRPSFGAHLAARLLDAAPELRAEETRPERRSA